jgi:hypothetical protein
MIEVLVRTANQGVDAVNSNLDRVEIADEIRSCT